MFFFVVVWIFALSSFCVVLGERLLRFASIDRANDEPLYNTTSHLFVCFSFLYKAMVISYSQVKMSYNAKFKPRSRYPFKNSVGYIVV